MKTRAAPSARRIAANRRNAQRSTGPRTAAGKKRASRNALKHGLCSPYACLDGECHATYATFVAELEQELQPRTPLQRTLLPHIANLLWRIDRLPQAQVEMFERELNKCGGGRGKRKMLSASQVLARRFSEDPTGNGFLLIGRYERSLHNQLHRLMSRYEWLKKHRATMPIDEDEVMIERRRRDAEIEEYVAECARRTNAESEAERAREAARREAVHQESARREAAPHASAEPQADDRDATDATDATAATKRTQSNPSPIADAATKTRKCAIIDATPVTKRTHHDPALARAAQRPSRARADNPPGM